MGATKRMHMDQVQGIVANKALWQIEQDYLELNNLLIENDGEITDEINERLFINKNELEHKSSNYAYVIKSNEADCDAIDKEIERLSALKKSRVTASERLKFALKNAMEIYGMEKIETPLMKIGFRKSESVEIENEELISAEYKNTKLVTTVSKAAIKDAIKAGKIVMGASLVTNNNLQIK